MWRDTIRELVDKELAPKAEEVDKRGEFPWDNLEILSKHQLLGTDVPEEYGGAGSDTLAHVIALEEVARVCPSTSVIMTTQALALCPFLLAGTEGHKRRCVIPLAQGKVLGSFGLTEQGAGSDAAAISTTAVLDGNEYVLNGTKCFITNAGISEIYTVMAMTDKAKRTRGISAFLVEKGTEGFSFGKEEDKMGMRGSVTRELIFEDCRVPKENLIGEEGEGFILAMKCFDRTRPGVGAQGVGIAQGALTEAINYAKGRVQFGQPISNLQGIQFMLVDMATQVEAARALVWKAASLIDQGDRDVTKFSAMAKMFATDVAMKVTVDAVQIFGGYGYMRDYPVERYMRDAKITQIWEGTNQIQKLVIARQILR